MADGSINFDTKCDDSGIKKLSSVVKTSMDRISKDMKNVFNSKGRSQEAVKSVAQLKKEFERAGKAVDEQKIKVEELQKKLEALQNNEDVYGEPEAAKPLIADAERLNEEISKAKSKVNEFSEQWKNGVSGAESKQEAWNKKVAQLTAKYDETLKKIEQIEAKSGQPIGDEAKAQRIEEIGNQIVEEKAVLSELETKADSAKQKLNETLNPDTPSGFNDALNSAGIGIEKFTKRVIGLAKRVFIFTVITKALRKLKEILSSSFGSDPQISKSLNNIRSNLYTAFQPIYEFVIPAVHALVAWLERASRLLAVVMAKIFHRNVVEMQKNAKALRQQAKATKDLGKEAEKAATSLAGFDEINALSDNSQSSADAAVENGPEFNTDFTSWTNEEMQKKLDELLVIIGGVMVVIGAILLFSGANIPLGLGLMAVGAVILASEIAANWDSMTPELKRTLSVMLGIIGTVILVIGVILAFTGHIPLGIAMIIAGAAIIVSAIAVSWNDLPPKVQKALIVILGIIGALVAVVGVILLMIGNLPLGIAMVIAGAAALVTAAALKEGLVGGSVEDFLKDIMKLLAWGAIVVGILLLISGVNIPLGIAFLAVGAAKVISDAVINSELLPEKVKSVLGIIMQVIGIVMSALGIILIVFGIYPLGVACLIAGLSLTIAGAKIAPWSSLGDNIDEQLSAIMKIIGGALVALGVFLCIVGMYPLGIACIIAGIGAFVASYTVPNWGEDLKNKIKDVLNGIIDIVERAINFIIDKINTLSWDIPDWVVGVGGRHFGFDLSHVNIPRLATGTVVPANRGEFLSVLGDNKNETEVVSPLSTMKQAFKEALAESGTGAAGDMSITVYLSVADVTKAVVNRVNGTTKQTGTCPIKLKV